MGGGCVRRKKRFAGKAPPVRCGGGSGGGEGRGGGALRPRAGEQFAAGEARGDGGTCGGAGVCAAKSALRGKRPRYAAGEGQAVGRDAGGGRCGRGRGSISPQEGWGGEGGTCVWGGVSAAKSALQRTGGGSGGGERCGGGGRCGQAHCQAHWRASSVRKGKRYNWGREGGGKALQGRQNGLRQQRRQLEVKGMGLAFTARRAAARCAHAGGRGCCTFIRGIWFPR